MNSPHISVVADVEGAIGTDMEAVELFESTPSATTAPTTNLDNDPDVIHPFLEPEDDQVLNTPLRPLQYYK